MSTRRGPRATDESARNAAGAPRGPGDCARQQSSRLFPAAQGAAPARARAETRGDARRRHLDSHPVPRATAAENAQAPRGAARGARPQLRRLRQRGAHIHRGRRALHFLVPQGARARPDPPLTHTSRIEGAARGEGVVSDSRSVACAPLCLFSEAARRRRACSRRTRPASPCRSSAPKARRRAGTSRAAQQTHEHGRPLPSPPLGGPSVKCVCANQCVSCTSRPASLCCTAAAGAFGALRTYHTTPTITAAAAAAARSHASTQQNYHRPALQSSSDAGARRPNVSTACAGGK
jgi:hypothetical protein